MSGRLFTRFSFTRVRLQFNEKLWSVNNTAIQLDSHGYVVMPRHYIKANISARNSWHQLVRDNCSHVWISCKNLFRTIASIRIPVCSVQAQQNFVWRYPLKMIITRPPLCCNFCHYCLLAKVNLQPLSNDIFSCRPRASTLTFFRIVEPGLPGFMCGSPCWRSRHRWVRYCPTFHSKRMTAAFFANQRRCAYQVHTTIELSFARYRSESVHHIYGIWIAAHVFWVRGMRLVTQFTAFVHTIKVATRTSGICHATQDTIFYFVCGLCLDGVVSKNLSLHGVSCCARTRKFWPQHQVNE